MDLKEYQLYVQSLEKHRHPWEVARAQVIQALLRPVLNAWQNQEKTVLDVGCGDGYFLHLLHQQWPAFSYVAVDSALDEDTCRWMRTTWAADHWQFYRELSQLPAPSQAADLLLLLDVLEHIEEDRAFLGTLAQRLRPGGCLLITVPAYQGLFTRHDTWLNHYRRYNLDQLTARAAEHNLTVLRGGYFFSGLVLPRLAGRLLEKAALAKRPPSGIGKWEHGQALCRLISTLLVWNGKFDILLQRNKIPWFGLSCFVLCQK